MLTLQQRFENAVHLVGHYTGPNRITPGVEQQLRMYALYKQATVGPCREPKPSFFAIREAAKWSAWSALRNMPAEQAKREYIAVIAAGWPAWEQWDGLPHRVERAPRASAASPTQLDALRRQLVEDTHRLRELERRYCETFGPLPGPDLREQADSAPQPSRDADATAGSGIVAEEEGAGDGAGDTDDDDGSEEDDQSRGEGGDSGGGDGDSDEDGGGADGSGDEEGGVSGGDGAVARAGAGAGAGDAERLAAAPGSPGRPCLAAKHLRGRIRELEEQLRGQAERNQTLTQQMGALESRLAERQDPWSWLRRAAEQAMAALRRHLGGGAPVAGLTTGGVVLLLLVLLLVRLRLRRS